MPDAFAVDPAGVQPADYAGQNPGARRLSLIVNESSFFFKTAKSIEIIWEDRQSRKISLAWPMFLFGRHCKVNLANGLGAKQATLPYFSPAALNALDAALLAVDNVDTAAAPTLKELDDRIAACFPSGSDAATLEADKTNDYQPMAVNQNGASAFERFTDIKTITDAGQNCYLWVAMHLVVDGYGRRADRRVQDDAPADNDHFDQLLDAVLGPELADIQGDQFTRTQVRGAVVKLLARLKRAPPALRNYMLSDVDGLADELRWLRDLESSDEAERLRTLVERLDLMLVGRPLTKIVLDRASESAKSGILTLLFKAAGFDDPSNLAAWDGVETSLGDVQYYFSDVADNVGAAELVTELTKLLKRQAKMAVPGGGGGGGGSGAAEDVDGPGGGGSSGLDLVNELKDHRVDAFVTKLQTIDKEDSKAVVAAAFASKVPLIIGLMRGHHASAATVRPELRRVSVAGKDDTTFRLYLIHRFATVRVEGMNGAADEETAEGGEYYTPSDEYVKMAKGGKLDLTTMLREIDAINVSINSKESAGSDLATWLERLDLAPVFEDLFANMLESAGLDTANFGTWLEHVKSSYTFENYQQPVATLNAEFDKSLQRCLMLLQSQVNVAVSMPMNKMPTLDLTEANNLFQRIQDNGKEVAMLGRRNPNQLHMQKAFHTMANHLTEDQMLALMTGNLADGAGASSSAPPPDAKRSRNSGHLAPHLARFRPVGSDTHVKSTGKYLFWSDMNGELVVWDKARLEEKWRTGTGNTGKNVMPRWDSLLSFLANESGRRAMAKGAATAEVHEPANWLSIRGSCRLATLPQDFPKPAMS